MYCTGSRGAGGRPCASAGRGGGEGEAPGKAEVQAWEHHRWAGGETSQGSSAEAGDGQEQEESGDWGERIKSFYTT